MSGARLRDHRVLTAQVTALRRRGEGPARDGESADVARGALDALVWLTRGDPAPLGGALAVLPVAPDLVVTEIAAAEEIVRGRPSRCRDHARGVRNALRWARYAAEAGPIPDLQLPGPRIPAQRTVPPTPSEGPRTSGVRAPAGEHARH